MGTVTIRCTTTGEQVSTGLELSAETFATVQVEGHGFLCPACGEVHEWKNADAVVQPGKWPEEKLLNPE